jgi:hypothetical protein
MSVFYIVTRDSIGTKWSLDRADGLLGMKLAYSGAFFSSTYALSAAETAAFAAVEALKPIVLRLSSSEIPAALTTGVIDGAILPLNGGANDGLAAFDAANSGGFHAYTVDAGGRVAPVDLGNGSNYSPPDTVIPPPGQPAPVPDAGTYKFELILRADLGVDSVSGLDGATIAVVIGTATETDLARFFADSGMAYQAVVFTTIEEALFAYDAGRADALALPPNFAPRYQQSLQNPLDHILLKPDAGGPGAIATPVHIVEIALVYEAGLGREADIAGLNYWIDQVEAGLPLSFMAGFFLDSPEFTTRFGDDDAMSNGQFVDVMYRNVLGRSGEPAGVDFWVGAMNGGLEREAVLVGFAASPENMEGSRATSLQQTAPGYWDFA